MADIVAVVITNPNQPVKAVTVPDPQTIAAVELPSSTDIEIRAVAVPEDITVAAVTVPADQVVAFTAISEIGPPGFSGYSGYSGGGGGGGSFLSENVARVDPSGDDGTGVVGDLQKPFLTVQGAIDAIEAGSFTGPIIELWQPGNSESVTTSLSELTFLGPAYSDSSSNLSVITLTSTDRVHLFLDSCHVGSVIAATDDLDVFLIGNVTVDVTIRGTGSVGVFGNPLATCIKVESTTHGGDYISMFDFSSLNNVTEVVAGSGNAILKNCIVDSITTCNALYLNNSQVITTNNATTTSILGPQWVELGPDLVWISSNGAPTTEGTKYAGKGSLCTDYTNGDLYENKGTKASPNWQLVGVSGFSGYSGFCGATGSTGTSGFSGYSGFCGTAGITGTSGFSGYSGFCGLSGYSGFCGLSGYSGFSGTGTSGFSGYSGFCGLSGYSGYSGSGLSGYSGFSAASPGASGFSGYSGFCGLSGYSGFCGTAGTAGTSGFSGYSGFCGLSGYSGFSAASPGASGFSGYSGFCGLSGYSGFCGTTGSAGTSGFSGYSGFCGLSGYSGYSGFSGFSGPSLFPNTTQTDTDYTLALTDAQTTVKMSSASAHNLTVPPNGTIAFPTGTQIAIEQAGTATVTIVAGAGVTLQGVSTTSGQYSSVVLIKQATDTWWVSGAMSGYSGYSGFCGLSGYSGFSSTSGYSGFCGTAGGAGTSGFSGYSGPAINRLLVTQNVDLGQVAGAIVTKAGTITGAVGVGSSLFLERIMVPAAMTLTEIQCAMSIGFPATNQGAGTMSRSMVVYSFGNSTSLASVLSFSGTSAWNTGTVTAGASTSLTQFQGGWSTPLIQPMTFASSALPPGEYAVGQLFNFAQGSSTWTLAFYGDFAASTFLASAATNLTSATLGALSSGGLVGVSAFTGSGSTAVFGNAGTLAINNYELSSNTFAGSAASAIATATAISTKTFSIQARTIFSAAPSTAGVFASTALSAGSFIGTSGSLGAVTNVALGALNSSTLVQLTLPNFGFIGTGSNTSGFPTMFLAGIMSTGAIPTAITLTSTAVTYSGSFAFQQPWFAMVGS